MSRKVLCMDVQSSFIESHHYSEKFRGGVTGVFIILMVMMNSQCLLMSKFRELSSLHVKISKSCLQIF